MKFSCVCPGYTGKHDVIHIYFTLPAKAGVDPIELFKKNPGRFYLWHVKDIDKDMKGPQPVGTYRRF